MIMYKIPDIPTPKADINEIADFVEVQCLKKSNVSAREIFSSLDILTDEHYENGVPEDDELEHIIDDTFAEIERRSQFCGTRYPFELRPHGHVAGINPSVDETILAVYSFLLFATRLDMGSQRIIKGIDGALLFEELAEYVGKNYFGERAESFLFGTASQEENFGKKIESLTKQLGEGVGLTKRKHTSQKSTKDGGVDVVVWKSFADGSYGKLIGFGQCKTGTYWKESLTIVRPDSFCKKWFKQLPAIEPIRLFFISESILRHLWYEHTTDCGILFDRCRIMDYLPAHLPPSFLTKAKEWTNAVVESL